MERGGTHLSKRGGGGGRYTTPGGRGRVFSSGRGRSVDRRNVDNHITAGADPSSCDEHTSGKGHWKVDGVRQTSTHGQSRSDGTRKTSWQQLGDKFSNHSKSVVPSSSSKDRSSYEENSFKLKNSSKMMDGSSGLSGFSNNEASIEYQICSMSFVDEKSSRRNWVDGFHLTSAEISIDKRHLSSRRMGHERVEEVVEKADETGCSQHSPQCLADADRFDICPPKVGGSFVLKPSLLEKNREKRREIKRATEERKGSVLRDGMVLLKNYISVPEQVKIVKQCRRLGLGAGGFYQPGYRDGAKLHLKMMCLGKNWDPETSKYGEFRPTDGVRPPPIPSEFLQLVERSIEESHVLIANECGFQKAEGRLPWMTPNICLVNFYTTSGRLGLHQDRDESKESLCKGLPVVSVSIGDSADFLYGDQRDADKAEKVVLASGDVLIFGGKSRHIYHGVSSIFPNTAPKSLLEETNLRCGRLNLTFREY